MKIRSLPKSAFSILAISLLLIVVAFNRPVDLPLRILVFSKTEGFRHTSIEAGKKAFTAMAAAKGFSAAFTEDAAQFTTPNLKKYHAVVFLSTTG